MPNVVLKLVESELMGEFYFTKDQAGKAKELLKAGKYKNSGSFFLSQEGVDAAEDMFDMTNNPGRQYEREKYYGRGRSVSVGDIVEVDGVNYLCANIGWVIV